MARLGLLLLLTNVLLSGICSNPSFANEFYLMRGEVVTNVTAPVGNNLPKKFRFVIASTKEVCLVGLSTGEKNESFHLVGADFDRITIETTLISGEILEQTSKRSVDHLVEQKGNFDSSKLPLYQMKSLSSFPLCFSSGPKGIEVANVLNWESSLSNEFGTLDVMREGKKIRSITFEQSEDQSFSFDSRTKLKDFQSTIYRQGVKRIREKVVFEPYVSFEEPELWTAFETVERYPISADDAVSRVESIYVVSEFKLGDRAAQSYVESILSMIPDGTPVVRDGAVRYEWRGGKKVAAVDMSAINAGKDLLFTQRPWPFKSVLVVFLVVVVVAFLLLSIRRRTK